LARTQVATQLDLSRLLVASSTIKKSLYYLAPHMSEESAWHHNREYQERKCRRVGDTGNTTKDEPNTILKPSCEGGDNEEPATWG
jgi:hypothetical protein